MKLLKGNLIGLSILLLLISINSSSCFVSRTTIGNGPINKEDSAVVYSQARQFYLFLGLAALNKAQPKLPASPSYQIKSYNGLIDILITVCSFGIASSRTTKVLVRAK